MLVVGPKEFLKVIFVRSVIGNFLFFVRAQILLLC